MLLFTSSYLSSLRLSASVLVFFFLSLLFLLLLLSADEVEFFIPSNSFCAATLERLSFWWPKLSNFHGYVSLPFIQKSSFTPIHNCWNRCIILYLFYVLGGSYCSDIIFFISSDGWKNYIRNSPLFGSKWCVSFDYDVLSLLEKIIKAVLSSRISFWFSWPLSF